MSREKLQSSPVQEPEWRTPASQDTHTRGSPQCPHCNTSANTTVYLRWHPGRSLSKPARAKPRPGQGEPGEPGPCPRQGREARNRRTHLGTKPPPRRWEPGAHTSPTGPCPRPGVRQGAVPGDREKDGAARPAEGERPGASPHSPERRGPGSGASRGGSSAALTGASSSPHSAAHSGPAAAMVLSRHLLGKCLGRARAPPAPHGALHRRRLPERRHFLFRPPRPMGADTPLRPRPRPSAPARLPLRARRGEGSCGGDSPAGPHVLPPAAGPGPARLSFGLVLSPWVANSHQLAGFST